MANFPGLTSTLISLSYPSQPWFLFERYEEPAHLGRCDVTIALYVAYSIILAFIRFVNQHSRHLSITLR